MNPQQAEAVKEIEKPLLIIAGAGSGKTLTVASKIAYLIDQGAKAENILALAFNQKATNNSKHTGLPLLLALEMLRKERLNIANSEILMMGDSIERHKASQKTWAKNSHRHLWAKNPRGRIRRLPAFRFQRNHRHY